MPSIEIESEWGTRTAVRLGYEAGQSGGPLCTVQDLKERAGFTDREAALFAAAQYLGLLNRADACGAKA